MTDPSSASRTSSLKAFLLRLIPHLRGYAYILSGNQSIADEAVEATLTHLLDNRAAIYGMAEQDLTARIAQRLVSELAARCPIYLIWSDGRAHCILRFVLFV